MSQPRPPITRPIPQYEQIARHLRTEIEAGRLRHGERLPSTRDLAAEWGVSTAVISEAMNQLISDGLVVTRARTGRAVHAPEQTGTSRRPRRPQVVMIGGYAGSGKTEFGRILARETGWAILDKDTLTRFVVEAALQLQGLSRNDRESDSYLRDIRPAEYSSLLEAMAENIACGTSVVVTAPFLREFSDNDWIARTQAMCTKAGATLTLVWMRCDAQTMYGYVRHRDAARDTAKLADWPAYLAGVDTEFAPSVDHHIVENSTSSEPLSVQAARLLGAITVGDQSA